MSHLEYVLAGLVSIAVAAVPALAFEGELRFHNGPPSLSGDGTASVELEVETVTAELAPEWVEVRASFTFANRGEATVVTMSFPLAEQISVEYLDTYHAPPGELDDWLMKRYGLKPDEPVWEEAFPLPIEWEPSLPGDNLSTAGLTRHGSLEVTQNGEYLPAEIVYRARYVSSGHMKHTVYGDTFARWKVAFDAGESKTITCTFFPSYDSVQDGRLALGFDYPPYKSPAQTTAAGEGTITITYRGDALGAPVSFRSPGVPPAEVTADENETRIVWNYTALELGEDAGVFITLGKTAAEESRADSLRLHGLNPDKAGEPALVSVDNLPLRTGPSSEAPTVKGRPKLAKNAAVAVLESRGEWWRVRVPGETGDRGDGKDDVEGWIRWRYVDPATGEENVYAEFAYDGGA